MTLLSQDKKTRREAVSAWRHKFVVLVDARGAERTLQLSRAATASVASGALEHFRWTGGPSLFCSPKQPPTLPT